VLSLNLSLNLSLTLADFFSILLTTLSLRLLMYPGERSSRLGKVGLPESKNQVRVL
jgi:hypothetical protein